MTVELLHDKAKDKSLVVRVREDETVIEYVVCSHYNSQAPEGQRWDYGHYFHDIPHALVYYNEAIIVNRPSYDRLAELARQLIAKLVDDDWGAAIEYFTEDCEMTDNEMNYFEI